VSPNRAFARLLPVTCGLLLACPLHARAQQTAEISLMEMAQSLLEKHPLIRYQQAQTEIDRGLKLQASGAFDTVFSANVAQSSTYTPLTTALQEEYSLIGATGDSEVTDLSQAGFGVSRLFRSGISLNETAVLDRDIDNLLNPLGVNTANTNLQITVPLLRGRGRAVGAAAENAAATEVRASEFDLTNQISTLLTTGALDYWNLVADTRLLAIAQEAQARAQTDLENTQTLVNADRLPRENLNEVNATLARSASDSVAAEQNLLAARNQLAADIGLDEHAIADTSLVPSDDFPAIDSAEEPALAADTLQRYVRQALANRSDVLALNIRIEEQRILVVAAKNRLLPQLNIVANGGYNGLTEGKSGLDYLDATVHNVNGPNVSGGLTYNFAPKNETSRGAYAQALATQMQLEAQSAQLAHTISAAVSTAAQGVRHAAMEVNRTQSAVAFFRRSLEGQRDKYHLGMASVVDVLTVEDRLTNAMTAGVQAQLAYASALTQLRFATGTIVAPGKTTVTLQSDTFRTLPPSAPSTPTP